MSSFGINFESEYSDSNDSEYFKNPSLYNDETNTNSISSPVNSYYFNNDMVSTSYLSEKKYNLHNSFLKDEDFDENKKSIINEIKVDENNFNNLNEMNNLSSIHIYSKKKNYEIYIKEFFLCFIKSLLNHMILFKILTIDSITNSFYFNILIIKNVVFILSYFIPLYMIKNTMNLEHKILYPTLTFNYYLYKIIVVIIHLLASIVSLIITTLIFYLYERNSNRIMFDSNIEFLYEKFDDDLVYNTVIESILFLIVILIVFFIKNKVDYKQVLFLIFLIVLFLNNNILYYFFPEDNISFMLFLTLIKKNEMYKTFLYWIINVIKFKILILFCLL